MKKTLFLAAIIGLLPLTPSAWGEGTTYYWDEQEDVCDFSFKNKKDVLIIGELDPGAAEGSVAATEYDIGNHYLYNNVITGENATLPKPDDADNPDASPKTYTYGQLKMADKITVNIGASKVPNSGNYNTAYTTVGSLSLGNNTTFTITDRTLTVTGLPYTDLGSKAKIILSSAAEGATGGILSMGPPYQQGDPDWDAVTISGANEKTGIITNNSEAKAVLGTETAVNVEYNNVRIDTNGSVKTTNIVAKLGNATINNGSHGGELIVSGGKCEGASVAVAQVNTGRGSTSGNVTLLNRGTDKLKMDAIYLGEGTTLKARQGDANSLVSTIEMNAFDSELNTRVDTSSGMDSYGLIFEEEAKLDADLILGTGSTNDAVVFGSWALEIDDYKADDSSYKGLDMMENNVTIRKGVALMAWFDEAPTTASEIILFSNVDQLTLGSDKTFDGIYFDYTAGFSASDYFSTVLTDNDTLNYFHKSLSAPELDEEGNKVGWFLEYRAIGDGSSSGNVYLVYNTLNIPEPTSTMLGLVGMVALSFRRRRK